MISLLLASLLAILPQQQPAPADITWKAVLMTGDNQIDAFDNARKALKNEFVQIGISPPNLRELSMSPAENQRGVTASSAENLKSSLLTSSAPATAGANRCPVASESSYGLTPANPVKVGLDEKTGPEREAQYLKALRGAAGQTVRATRIGSALSGTTVLHIYELSYEGLEQPVAV